MDPLSCDLLGLHDTEHLGRRIGACLRGGDVLALRGELGAGKTCFVRGLCEGLGGDPSQVNSPTFVIMQDYDDYRLNDLISIEMQAEDIIERIKP